MGHDRPGFLFSVLTKYHDPPIIDSIARDQGPMPRLELKRPHRLIRRVIQPGNQADIMPMSRRHLFQFTICSE